MFWRSSSTHHFMFPLGVSSFLNAARCHTNFVRVISNNQQAVSHKVPSVFSFRVLNRFPSHLTLLPRYSPRKGRHDGWDRVKGAKDHPQQHEMLKGSSKENRPFLVIKYWQLRRRKGCLRFQISGNDRSMLPSRGMVRSMRLEFPNRGTVVRSRFVNASPVSHSKNGTSPISKSRNGGA